MKEEEIFSSAAFPLIRRVRTKMISSELVKVMPLSAPVGHISFLDINGDIVKVFSSEESEKRKKAKDLEDFYDENY